MYRQLDLCGIYRSKERNLRLAFQHKHSPDGCTQCSTITGSAIQHIADVALDQGRPAKNMGPVPNYTLGPQSNKANFEYLYIMLEHIFKIKSDVLIPFFF